MRNIFFILLALALLAGCNPKNTYVKYQGQTQGTFYNITFDNPAKAELKPSIDSLLNAFEDSWSTFRSNSIVSKINQAQNPKLDLHFVKVFDRAALISKITDGAFDMTVAPLVNAWGFGFKEQQFPDSAMVDSLLTFVGMQNLRLDESGNYLQKTNPLIMIDGSAIAKGYSVDLVGHFLQEKGITNFLIEIGGEIVARGVNSSGEAWRVGIDKPIDDPTAAHRELQSVLKLTDRALATSGNYRRFYVKNGKKYAHTINPKSGFPVEHNLLSATVIADDCMTADALATAFMVMGVEKSKNFVAAHSDLRLDIFLIFQTKNNTIETFSTKGFEENYMVE